MKMDPDKVLDVYFFLFLQFDHNSNGFDLEEFMSVTKRIMLVVVDELRLLPLKTIP